MLKGLILELTFSKILDYKKYFEKGKFLFWERKERHSPTFFSLISVLFVRESSSSPQNTVRKHNAALCSRGFISCSRYTEGVPWGGGAGGNCDTLLYMQSILMSHPQQ